MSGCEESFAFKLDGTITFMASIVIGRLLPASKQQKSGQTIKSDNGHGIPGEEAFSR
jgi:hypothetical protein